MTMPQEYPPLVGWLTTKGGCYQVQLCFASRFSLWAVFDIVVPSVSVDNLDVRVGGRDLCLGPCTVLLQEEGERIVWMTPSRFVHDLDSLFARAEISVLGMEVPWVTNSAEYREGIDQVFRDSLLELTYELNAYMAHLDRLDDKYQAEVPEVRLAIQSSIIVQTTPSFFAALDTWNRKLVQFARHLSKVEREHYGLFFRHQIWSILLRAPFLAQTNLRGPRDAVDPEAQRMVQLNDHEGTSTFGKLLHKYSVELPSSQASRNTRDECAQMVRNRLLSHDTKRAGPLKVLSIPCGSAIEWEDILKTPEVSRKVDLSLLDQDPLVLAQAAGRIADAERLLGVRVAVEYIESSLKTALEPSPFRDPSVQFDFIYSLDLLDYLTDNLARAVVRKLYELLAPGGELILANATTDGSDGLLEEYWNHVKRHERSEQEFLSLVPPVLGADTTLHYDATAVQMVLKVSKAPVSRTREAVYDL